MDRDFTFAVYQKILDTLVETGYTFETVAEALENENRGTADGETGKKICIIRHDVDHSPKKALKMALLEKQKNIHATYYFRFLKNIYQPDTMKKIEEMGHEVGYHYETLCKKKGDKDQAWALFLEELADMRKHVDIKTACMHGSPMCKYNNLDIWQEHKPEEAGLLGEAYLSFDFSKWFYFSDTGRRWDSKYSVRDGVTNGKNTDVISSFQLIRFIKREKPDKLYITAHPSKWAHNMSEWFIILANHMAKNPIKLIIKKMCSKNKC